MKTKLRKTTLVLHHALVAELKREALRQNCTMSELVEAALRSFFLTLKSQEKRDLPPLPTHDFGEQYVDIADRDALYEKMGGRR